MFLCRVFFSAKSSEPKPDLKDQKQQSLRLQSPQNSLIVPEISLASMQVLMKLNFSHPSAAATPECNSRGLAEAVAQQKACERMHSTPASASFLLSQADKVAREKRDGGCPALAFSALRSRRVRPQIRAGKHAVRLQITTCLRNTCTHADGWNVRHSQKNSCKVCKFAHGG